MNSRDGNVAMIAGVMMLVLCTVVGMATDYSLAARRRDQLNGIADAAALAAVTPNMMTQSFSTASAAAKTMFNAQAATVTNVTSVTPTMSGGDVAGAQTNRTVTITYTANSKNAFAALLGVNSIPISGTSTATSTQSPNTDFYMLLDTSGSMAIGATTADITALVNATNTPANAGGEDAGGCGFACHQTYPAGDKIFNPGGVDNYALARQLGLTLRIDLVKDATSHLMDVASQMATQNNTKYRSALYTVSYQFNGALQTLTDLQTAKNASANIGVSDIYYTNNSRSSTNKDWDEDTNINGGLSQINTIMPTPGNGTNNAGDTPKELLMIVSDGVNDYDKNGVLVNPSSANRIMAAVDVNNTICSAIKARGIKIAFLYLVYNPMPGSWAASSFNPILPTVAPAATACASPGLFYQVNTDGDVTTALANLFEKAVSTAHLIT